MLAKTCLWELLNCMHYLPKDVRIVFHQLIFTPIFLGSRTRALHKSKILAKNAQGYNCYALILTVNLNNVARLEIVYNFYIHMYQVFLGKMVKMTMVLGRRDFFKNHVKESLQKWRKLSDNGLLDLSRFSHIFEEKSSSLGVFRWM